MLDGMWVTWADDKCCLVGGQLGNGVDNGRYLVGSEKVDPSGG